MKIIISESQLKYIIETSKLNLNDRDNVVDWLNKNGPDSIFDDDGNIDWDYVDSTTGDDLETMIYTYIEKYNEVSSESEIEIYRLVMLNDINDLDLKNVGVFWSFNENGVGAYGIGKKFSGDKPYILNAIINTDDIDWEQGLYSFILYGKSEFECYVKKGSECIITHINEKKLVPPIKAIC